jgi:hypothetical protein
MVRWTAAETAGNLIHPPPLPPAEAAPAPALTAGQQQHLQPALLATAYATPVLLARTA